VACAPISPLVKLEEDGRLYLIVREHKFSYGTSRV
jgi:hypothetical protein